MLRTPKAADFFVNKVTSYLKTNFILCLYNYNSPFYRKCKHFSKRNEILLISAVPFVSLHFHLEAIAPVKLFIWRSQTHTDLHVNSGAPPKECAKQCLSRYSIACAYILDKETARNSKFFSEHAIDGCAECKHIFSNHFNLC